jgi:hypothetical protein
MAAIVIISVIVIFIAGVIAGMVLLVSWASIREDRRPRLSREAPDRITAAGRYVTRLDIRRPEEIARPARPRRRNPDDEMVHSTAWPRRNPWS